jgi:adenylate cyclase
LTDPETLTVGLIAVVVASCFAAIPLLHRFSSAAALTALTILAYLDTFRVSWEAGTGGGYWLAYFAAIGLIVILLGAEHFVVSGILAALAGGLIITLHLVTPFNAGSMSPEALLYEGLITNVVFYTLMLFAVSLYAARQIARAEFTAERERDRSDTLLANILPASVANRLKEQPGTVVADRYDEASILFADMAGFTARAGRMTPEELVNFLNRVFSEFDRLVESHRLEKIKTTGDAYMVVSGVPEPRSDHAEALADLALEMRDALHNIAGADEAAVPLRIGIASGPVVAGVVGRRKFFYDVWGDAVNTASRMESTGEAGKIQVAPETHALLKDRFELEERGIVEVRGKGPMRTWFLTGRRTAADPPGIAPELSLPELPAAILR